MNKKLQKIFSSLIAFVMVVSACFSGSLTAFAAETTESKPSDVTPSGVVWTIGDSTVCNYSADKENTEVYNFRQGWGMRFGDYFKDSVTVKNIAASGASSRDFPEHSDASKKDYPNFKNTIAKGDYVFVQFGHNDSKNFTEEKYLKIGSVTGVVGPNGETWKDLPESSNGIFATGTYTDYKGAVHTAEANVPSFEWYMYNYYIKPALDVGAVPVLVSPVTRTSSNVSKGSITEATAVDYKSHIPYSEAMQTLSEEYNIPFIDLCGKSVDYWNKTYWGAETGTAGTEAGLEALLNLHAKTVSGGVATAVDRTHLSKYGASIAAGFVADDVKTQGLSLATLLKDSGDGDGGDETPSNKISFGDFNKDGLVDFTDASEVLRYVLDKTDESFKNYDEINIKLGDVDGDGILTARDASSLVEKILDGTFEFAGKDPEIDVDETYTKETTTEGTTTEGTTTEGTTTEGTTTEGTTTEGTTTEGTTTEGTTEATTEGTTEGTTEATTVDPEAQTKIYEGYDIAVDARAASDENRDSQPIFKTIREAIDYAAENDNALKADDGRITIGIVPGTYREQLIINTPDITLESISSSTSTAEETKITWYYGVSYIYYNIGEDGYWDPSREGATDYLNKGAAKWGATVNVQSNATGFIAKGIVFENSFNQYVTAEELKNGVKAVDQKPERNGLTVGSDVVRQRDYRERSAGLSTEADKAQYIDCSVIGTQDSLYLGEGRVYFKDSIIEGNTDYIFGNGQALFDSCTLQVGGDNVAGDSMVITAMDTNLKQIGALFYNCRVSSRSDVPSKASSFGRPWKQDAGAAFINTIIENCTFTGQTSNLLISGAGWGGMGDATPENARFKEYGSVDKNGKAVDTSKRTAGTVMTEYEAVKYNPYYWTSTFYRENGNVSDNWDPTGNKAIYDEIENDLKDVSLGIDVTNVTENIGLPEPVAGYEYYWVSNSDNAKVDNTGKWITITRPAYSMPDAEVKLTAYMKKAGTITGIEKNFDITVKAIDTTEGTQAVSGKVSLPNIVNKDVKVKLSVETLSGIAVAEKEVTILGGTISADYEFNLGNNGTYNITIIPSDSQYAVDSGDVKTVEVLEQPIELNIALGKLADVNVSTTGNVEIVNNDANAYTVTLEQNVEDKNQNKETAVHIAKKAGVASSANEAYYWNVAEQIPETEKATFKVAEVVTLKFKVKVNSMSEVSGSNLYMDILGAAGDTNFKFAQTANASRYARFRIGNNWNQMDSLGATMSTWSGSSDSEKQRLNLIGKLDSDGAETWKEITTTIDFKNGKLTVAGDKKTGELEFPTNIDREQLYFVMYPQAGKDLERNYWITPMSVSYQKLADPEEIGDVTKISGTAATTTSIDENKITLTSTTDPGKVYTLSIANGKIELSGAASIPAGRYTMKFKVAGDKDISVVIGDKTLSAMVGEEVNEDIVVLGDMSNFMSISEVKYFTVSGSYSDGITGITLTNKEDESKVYKLEDLNSEDKTYEFKNLVKNGTYIVSAIYDSAIYEKPVFTVNEKPVTEITVNNADVVLDAAVSKVAKHEVTINYSEGINKIVVTDKNDATNKAEFTIASTESERVVKASLKAGSYTITAEYSEAEYKDLAITSEKYSENTLIVDGATSVNVTVSPIVKLSVSGTYTKGVKEITLTSTKNKELVYKFGEDEGINTTEGGNFTISGLLQDEYTIAVAYNDTEYKNPTFVIGDNDPITKLDLTKVITNVTDVKVAVADITAQIVKHNFTITSGTNIQYKKLTEEDYSPAETNVLELEEGATYNIKISNTAGKEIVSVMQEQNTVIPEVDVYSVTMGTRDITWTVNEIAIFDVNANVSNVSKIVLTPDSTNSFAKEYTFDSIAGGADVSLGTVREGKYTVTLTAAEGYEDAKATAKEGVVEVGENTTLTVVKAVSATDFVVTASVSFNEAKLAVAVASFISGLAQEDERVVLDSSIFDISSLTLDNVEFSISDNLNNLVAIDGTIKERPLKGEQDVVGKVIIKAVLTENRDKTKEIEIDAVVKAGKTNTFYATGADGNIIGLGDVEGVAYKAAKDDTKGAAATYTNTVTDRNLVSTDLNVGNNVTEEGNGIYVIKFSVKNDNWLSATDVPGREIFNLTDANGNKYLGFKVFRKAGRGIQLVVDATRDGAHDYEGASYPEYLYDGENAPDRDFSANEWFDFTIVANTITDNIKVIVKGEDGIEKSYICKSKGALLPEKLQTVFQNNEGVESSVLSITDVTVENSNDLVTGFNTVMQNIEIPKLVYKNEIKEIDLPILTAGGSAIVWSVTPETNAAEVDATIGYDDGKCKLTLTPQKGETKVTLKAEIRNELTGTYDIIKNSKEYPITLEGTSAKSIKVSGTVKTEGNAAEDITVNVKLTSVGQTLEKEVTIASNSNSVDFAFDEVPVGNYTVSAEISKAEGQYGVKAISGTGVTDNVIEVTEDSVDIDNAELTIVGIKDTVKTLELSEKTIGDVFSNATSQEGYVWSIENGKLKIVMENTNVSPKYTMNLTNLMTLDSSEIAAVDGKFKFNIGIEVPTEGIPRSTENTDIYLKNGTTNLTRLQLSYSTTKAMRIKDQLLPADLYTTNDAKKADFEAVYEYDLNTDTAAYSATEFISGRRNSTSNALTVGEIGDLTLEVNPSARAANAGRHTWYIKDISIGYKEYVSVAEAIPATPTYSVKLNVEDSAKVSSVTLNDNIANLTNGSYSISNIEANGIVLAEITPAEGYEIVDVYSGGKSIEKIDGKYKISVVDKNVNVYVITAEAKTVKATVAKGVKTLKLEGSYTDEATATTKTLEYTWTRTNETGEIVVELGNVVSGVQYTVTAEVDEGYKTPAFVGVDTETTDKLTVKDNVDEGSFKVTSESEETAGTYEVSITVTDADNSIDKIKITPKEEGLQGIEMTKSTQGSIWTANVANGTYTVTVESKLGLQKEYKYTFGGEGFSGNDGNEVTVNGAPVSDLTITATETYKVSITVTDADNSINKIKITPKEEGSQEIEMTAPEQGSVWTANVENGIYTVTVESKSGLQKEYEYTFSGEGFSGNEVTVNGAAVSNLTITAAETAETYKVSITVTDVDNSIEKIKITPKTADSQGIEMTKPEQGSIWTANVKNGTYTVTVESKQGLQKTYEYTFSGEGFSGDGGNEVTVNGAEVSNLTITAAEKEEIAEGYKVELTVNDATGTIDLAPLTINIKETLTGAEITGKYNQESGNFDFTGVANGTYKVIVPTVENAEFYKAAEGESAKMSIDKYTFVVKGSDITETPISIDATMAISVSGNIDDLSEKAKKIKLVSEGVEYVTDITDGTGAFTFSSVAVIAGDSSVTKDFYDFVVLDENDAKLENVKVVYAASGEEGYIDSDSYKFMPNLTDAYNAISDINIVTSAFAAEGTDVNFANFRDDFGVIEKIKLTSKKDSSTVYQTKLLDGAWTSLKVPDGEYDVQVKFVDTVTGASDLDGSTMIIGNVSKYVTDIENVTGTITISPENSDIQVELILADPINVVLSGVTAENLSEFEGAKFTAKQNGITTAGKIAEIDGSYYIVFEGSVPDTTSEYVISWENLPTDYYCFDENSVKIDATEYTINSGTSISDIRKLAEYKVTINVTNNAVDLSDIKVGLTANGQLKEATKTESGAYELTVKEGDPEYMITVHDGNDDELDTSLYSIEYSHGDGQSTNTITVTGTDTTISVTISDAATADEPQGDVVGAVKSVIYTTKNNSSLFRNVIKSMKVFY